MDMRSIREDYKKISTTEQTGLSYFGARYYDAGLSIWLSVDPMADKQINLSPYHYCAGNPVVLKDPDGKSPILIGAIVGGLIEAGSQAVSNVTQGNSPFKNLDWADIGIAAAEGAYIGSGARVIGQLVSTPIAAFSKASVDANSTGFFTIIPGVGDKKDKMDFGKELGAALIGGAFGRLFDSEFGQLLLDGVIDGGLKNISKALEPKMVITLKEVVVKPDMKDEDLFKTS
jgi:RHS repeat-associated protein